MAMTPDERTSLQDEIQQDYNSKNWTTKAWSSVHHGFLFGSVILSACAALAIEIEWALSSLSTKQTGALLAGSAALAGTLAATGGFQRKWKTNRRTKGKLKTLLRDLGDPQADGAAIRARLEKIWEEHDGGILGEG